MASTFVQRLGFVLRNPYFGLTERIKMAAHLRSLNGSVERALMRRLVEQPDGDYFQIGRWKVFFGVEHEIKDRDYFMLGIRQVLIESYVYPTIFSRQVRLGPGDVCVDLGGAIGTTAMLFSGIVGPSGKVYAFEPVTHGTLERNVTENAIGNLEIIAKGVSDQPGTTEIEISDFCLDSSIAKREYTKDAYGLTREIELTTLDAFVGERGLAKVDFIKVDIEGAEELAIRGAEQLIRSCHPKWSISSYHIDFANEPQHPKLVALLKGYGYRIQELGQKHIFAWT